MFTIKSLKIYQECRYRKNLKEGTFFFEDCSIDDFYGKNITLHTIVGKNGSGKSSLLDIVFRILNNMGALMCKYINSDSNNSVRYVRYIYADLLYEKLTSNMCNHKAMLCVRDTAIWLLYDDTVYWLSDKDLIQLYPEIKNYLIELENKYGKDNIVDYSDLTSNDKKKKVASMLFYTIATNYSILGFRAGDYAEEDSLNYEKGYLLAEDGSHLLFEDNSLIDISHWVSTKNWLSGIFHKNDGYLCPIVLNPYRDQGMINMDIEASLTQNRLASILLSGCLDENPLIEDYYLDDVKYELKEEFYLKFKPIYSKNDKKHKNNLLGNNGDLQLFKAVSSIKGTRSWIILDSLECPILENMSKVEIFARMYIVYKILNIAATYPHYEKYRHISNINGVFFRGKCAYSSYRALVGEIILRNTHIEQKVHQTLNFIKLLNKVRQSDHYFNFEWLENTFTFNQYKDYFRLENNQMKLEDFIEKLPPNIFKQQIYLRRKLTNNQWDSNILFSHLSSGQKQLLYQLSSIVYHLINIKSIPEEELHYDDINIVLDEIEVCFHPEFQRTFIARLIDLVVNTLHLNKTLSIHFWLTTHSPFILSDIPQNLITYMENGRQLTNDEIKLREILPPTAANISEILHQSFFLKNGFIGEYVRRKILSLVKFLQSEEKENEEWTLQKAKTFMGYIEEPFISTQLKKLYNNKSRYRNEKNLYK